MTMSRYGSSAFTPMESRKAERKSIAEYRSVWINYDPLMSIYNWRY